jgi:hypothetical protein
VTSYELRAASCDKDSKGANWKASSSEALSKASNPSGKRKTVFSGRSVKASLKPRKAFALSKLAAVPTLTDQPVPAPCLCLVVHPNSVFLERQVNRVQEGGGNTGEYTQQLNKLTAEIERIPDVPGLHPRQSWNLPTLRSVQLTNSVPVCLWGRGCGPAGGIGFPFRSGH